MFAPLLEVAESAVVNAGIGKVVQTGAEKLIGKENYDQIGESFKKAEDSLYTSSLKMFGFHTESKKSLPSVSGGASVHVNNVEHNPVDLMSAFSSFQSSKLETNSESVIEQLKGTNPIMSSVVSAISQIKDDNYIHDDPLFKKIYDIYDGNVSKPIYNSELKRFECIDETGQLQFWEYPKWNTYTVVPAIHGRWTGINSANNGLPIDKVDTIAMLHDIDFHNSSVFDRVSDYKLLSRLIHQSRSLNIEEKMVAKIALDWFSSLGHVARYAYGTENTNVATIHRNKIKTINEIFNDLITPVIDKPITPITPDPSEISMSQKQLFYNSAASENSRIRSIVDVKKQLGRLEITLL